MSVRAIRLHEPGGLDGLRVEEISIPEPRAGEAIVRVHAAAITRDELEWPVDRLPAIPSYEMSGVVEALGSDVADLTLGHAVYALTPFDRDGAAAEYVAVPAELLAPKPQTIDHVESAVIPLAALSAWQGLFDQGGLRDGERVLIHGAVGGVGHLATQLARWRGAHVIGTASGARTPEEAGVDEIVDRDRFEEAARVDLVFDTVGGDALARSPVALRDGGRIVSVAEELPGATFFIVEPSRDQLVELAGLVDAGVVRPSVDSVYPLEQARTAFERSMKRGKRGKVVLRIAHD
jgi:NADPH:quinone reductase-like Zn-dependent oxidoreductase